MKVFPTKAFFGVLSCCAAIIICSPRAAGSEGQAAESNASRPQPAWRYVSSTESGKFREYITDAQGGNQLLIRSSAETASGTQTDLEIAEKEAEPTRLWMLCKARVSSGPLPDRLTEHDAWLDTADRLEGRLRQDPGHLGVLRDLIVAYVRLLDFESSTSLGANICLLGGRRISEFERNAAPLGPADRHLVDSARAAIFYSMRLYPCVFATLERSADAAEISSWRQALGVLGQYDFTDLGTTAVGAMNVRTFRNAGSPADPRLLWDELYFVISGHDPMAPEGTTAYVLVRQGPPGRENYYLYFRCANRSQLVFLYGKTRPADADLRAWIEGSVRAATAGSKKA